MDESFQWIVYACAVPTIQQGAWITVPLLLSAAAIRICVYLHVSTGAIHVLCILLGISILWIFYSTGIVYFIVLCGIVYGLLQTTQQYRGVVIAVASIIYLLICETTLASATEWHQVRGSFLVMVMRMVSLGFDMDPVIRNREKKPPKIAKLPNPLEYAGYCLFPATSIFGPFLVYEEHMKFLDSSPISISWVYNVTKAWMGSMFCLAISSCFMPFLFTEPKWNKWLASYSAAASFRYSHYFVSLLSQSTTMLSGIGKSSTDDWSRFHVVNPLSIELPRSLGTVVTNWNLPMHVFLKNYVYKPSRSYIGRFGAVLLTYLASAMLHGLNFQLGAVLLSIGIYAYIENVLRFKLSVRLNACVLDRPCSEGCSHYHKETTLWVYLLNISFSALSMFHLAYLGLMFGSQSPEEMELQLQGFSMLHTLQKWAHLNFLSHWIALMSYLLYIIL